MSYLIAYTSENNGITIGVLGTSYADALAKLAEEFGEEVVAPYAEARAELESLVAQVEQADAASKRAELASRLAGSPGSVAASRDGASGDDRVDVDDERGGPAGDREAGGDGAADYPGGPEDFGATLDRLAATSAATREDADAVRGGEAPEAGTRPPLDDVTRCVVCGDPITDEMARASLLVKGEHRCAEDMA